MYFSCIDRYCCALGIPVVRDEVGYCYHRPFLRLFVPHFSLPSFQSHLFSALNILFSILLPLFQNSLNTVLKSHSTSSSPPFPFTFGHLISLPVLFFISRSFHLFQSTPHLFLHTIFLHSNLQSPLALSSLIRSRHTHNVLPSCFSQTFTFCCCFSINAIVSKPYIYDNCCRSVHVCPSVYQW